VFLLENQKITLVELAPTEFGKLDKEITKDVYYRFNTAPRALPLLHAILLQNGYKDVDSIYSKYSPHGKLSEKNWQRIKDSDYLLLSSITRTHPQTLELADRYKQMNPQGTVILGGPHATYLDEECLQNDSIDIIVRREGDNTLPELMQRLTKKESIEEVLGISYKKGSNIIRTSDRTALTEEELSALPKPVYDTQTSKWMVIPVLITSRGCPFDCDFCGVTDYYGKNYRKKSTDSIMDELKFLKRRYMFVGDDNFAGKPRQTEELLERMIDEKIKHRYGIQIDVHTSVRRGFAGKMHKAGVRNAFVGFEALDKESLDSVNKKNSQKKNEDAAETLRNAGIWVHGMFIVGLSGHDKSYLDYLTNWAIKYCDSAQFFSIVPIPGTRLTKEMEENKLIITKNYNLYDGHHVLTQPEKISPLELQLKIFDMHEKFYSNRDFSHSTRPILKRVTNRYALSMIKALENSPQTKQHIEFLKSIK
jgi:radical SAM superfamily enzyme YgiQ (UPF0313 family)